MTQHANPQHTVEDQQIMRRLALVIGSFIAATAVMAATVAFIMG